MIIKDIFLDDYDNRLDDIIKEEIIERSLSVHKPANNLDHSTVMQNSTLLLTIVEEEKEPTDQENEDEDEE